MLATVLLLCQIGLWLLLLFIVVHLVRSTLWARSLPQVGSAERPKAPPALPRVTVQLPIYNERQVAERVLRATCALSWPRDLLQVQVLDDSDDATSALVDQVAAELRREGHDISVCRRKGRLGYKAGNLQHALPHARGEYIAVLDADCVPPEDFLLRLVPPLLADERLAFAQGRWSFDNEEGSLLLRIQALILHGLMLVEQARLSALGLPLQFNGSGGVWRRSALMRAGGWLHGGPATEASVAEDLDLSYRAELLGYRALHLPEVAVRTELPPNMAAFRQQQRRWVRGGAQVLRSLLGRLSAGTLGKGQRVTMLLHLLRHARQPYLFLLCLWLPVLALHWVRPLYALPFCFSALLLAVHLSIGAYYGMALRRLGRSPLPALLLSPVLCALSLGLSLCLTAALLQGLLPGRRPAVFVRTPKTGDGEGAADQPAYRPLRDPLALWEVVIGLSQVACAMLLLKQGEVLSALFFLVFMAGGYLWVGLASLG